MIEIIIGRIIAIIILLGLSLIFFILSSLIKCHCKKYCFFYKRIEKCSCGRIWEKREGYYDLYIITNNFPPLISSKTLTN